MADLEHSGSRTPDVYYVKLTFSFIVTFYLTKAENKAKKFLTSSHTIALSKGTIFAKNANFLQKEILTSAKLKEPWY